LPEQIDRIRRDASDGGFHTLLVREAALHGAGSKSYIVVFRDDRLTELQPKRDGPWRSDELRIYDNDNGELEPRFQFQPKAAPAPYLFRLEAVRDLDGNGLPEVVGAFSKQGMSPIWPQPVGVAWSEREQYGIHSLLVDRPKLNAFRARTKYEKTVSTPYLRPHVLTDVATRRQVKGFRAEEYGIVRSGEEGAKLVAAFVSRAPASCCPELFELQAWAVDFARRTPKAVPCRLFDPRLQGRDAGGIFFEPSDTGPTSLVRRMRREWRRVEERVSC